MTGELLHTFGSRFNAGTRFLTGGALFIAGYPPGNPRRRIRGMAIVRDHAVAIRRYEYSETSQVIVFFTREHGLVRAIAKGIARSTKTRFGCTVDLLDVGQVSLSRRADRPESLAIVTEWRQSRCFTGLRDRLPRIYAAQYAAEVTAMLTEQWDPHPALYGGLVELLALLCESSDCLLLAVRFQSKLLVETGLWPRFDACIFCECMRDLTHFSSMGGGMICRECEASQSEKRTVSPAALAVLSGHSDPDGVVGAFVLLNTHIAHAAGKKPLVADRLVYKDQVRHTPL